MTYLCTLSTTGQEEVATNLVHFISGNNSRHIRYAGVRLKSYFYTVINENEIELGESTGEEVFTILDQDYDGMFMNYAHLKQEEDVPDEEDFKKILKVLNKLNRDQLTNELALMMARVFGQDYEEPDCIYERELSFIMYKDKPRLYFLRDNYIVILEFIPLSRIINLTKELDNLDDFEDFEEFEYADGLLDWYERNILKSKFKPTPIDMDFLNHSRLDMKSVISDPADPYTSVVALSIAYGLSLQELGCDTSSPDIVEIEYARDNRMEITD